MPARLRRSCSKKSSLPKGDYLLKALPGGYKKGTRIVDPSDYTEDQILAHYIGLIRKIALQRCQKANRMEDYEDCIQEGVIGLLYAIRHFDRARSEKPNTFHNLACVQINGRVSLYLVQNLNLGDMPMVLQPREAWGLSSYKQLQNFLQYLPGDTESVLRNWEAPEFEQNQPAHLVEHVRTMKRVICRFQGSPIYDQKHYSAALQALETLERSFTPTAVRVEPEAPQNQERELIAKDFLEKFLAPLSERSREIILSSLRGERLTEIGVRLKLSRQRICQIRDQDITSKPSKPVGRPKKLKENPE